MGGVEEAGANWLGAVRSVSDRIRDLDRAGHSRAEIARMLGKRYQHVRNVLEADRLKAAPVAVLTAPTDLAPTRFRLVVGDDGNLVLTPEAQAALGVRPGSVVIGLMRGESMMLTEGGASNRRAQALAMKYATPGVSMVDELIAERRARGRAGRMIERVLDSSAVIAFLLNEPGGQQIGPILKTSALTSVNLAEVAARLGEAKMPADEIGEVVDSLDCEIVSVSREVGLHAGLMRAATRHKGLSLGDRICLAFAKDSSLPVYTADRPWADVDVGVDVRLIR